MPERLEREVLQKARYINKVTLYTCLSRMNLLRFSVQDFRT